MGKHKKTALGTLVKRTTYYSAYWIRTKVQWRCVRHMPKRSAPFPGNSRKCSPTIRAKRCSNTSSLLLIRVYFAHPGSPWARGTNENTNGLIRQYFPKGTDFSKVSRYQIKRAQRRLNDRPRAVLHYEKPDEVINRLVALKV